MRERRTPSRPRRTDWAALARQALAFGVLAGLLVAMFHVTSANLHARGVQTGFEFLWKPAITPVYTSPIEFEAGRDTFARALLAGALNSLKVTAVAIVAATLIGIAVGLGSLARNPLARRLSAGYVELMRNVPVLLHIVFWYGLALELPPPGDANGHWLLASNRGIFLLPAVDGLDVQALVAISPEFFALCVGIALYTAAFIAEIVRASIGAVARGQWEACAALGLGRRTVLARVVAPQAFRVGIPALSSEYMGIFKNSTLAVAVGYQDFMAVGETMLTDTGQAMEILAMVVLFYASVSLVVSAGMHWFERRQHAWSHA